MKQLSENYFNRDNIAWCIRLFDKLLPNQKKTIIDKKDVDIFWKTERELKGKKKLAVVNQWHL